MSMLIGKREYVHRELPVGGQDVMNNLLSNLKTWIRDPFGTKREMEQNREVINRIIATRVRIKEQSKDIENNRMFPISHMVMYDRETGKD